MKDYATPGTLEDAIATFDRSAIVEHLARGTRERADILAQFPQSAWPTLPVTRYAVGQANSDNTFCWWIEFGSPHLGSVSGGSSTKLIIYKHKEKDGWYFPSRYANEQDAWSAVRAAFVRAFQL